VANTRASAFTGYNTNANSSGNANMGSAPSLARQTDAVPTLLAESH
jgi:hypothetical protein